MKQTAIEWLMPKILELTLQLSLRRISQRNCELEILRLFEEAKEMEKEPILEFTRNVVRKILDEDRANPFNLEQYYNQTYKQD